MSADLRHAKVYVSVIGTEEEVKGSLAALRHASGFIRAQLGAVLRMRHTPELHFVYDDLELRAARIEELLCEAATPRERE
jgi:ribosome-binding factor A